MLGVSIQDLLLLGIALLGLMAVWLFFRRSSKASMAVWTLTLFFIPVWVGAQVWVLYSAIAYVTLLIIVASIPCRFRVSNVDIVFSIFALFVLLGWSMGWVRWEHLLMITTGWLVPYIGGRLISMRAESGWIYTCLATGAVIAGILAIVEFLTRVNQFVLFDSSSGLYSIWGALQYRGGMLRVEGAFGHSIALGASLAMCSAFILVVRWPGWLRLLSLATVMAAVGMTFSRIGLIGLAFTLVAGLLGLGHYMTAKMRFAVAILMIIATTWGLPSLVEVFAAAGLEALRSAAYRLDLLVLVPQFSILGVSPSWHVQPDGDGSFGTFGSVDSELILTGLRFGLLPLVAILLALAYCIVSILRGRATPASIALVGQVPAFATVALITQYAGLVWFIAGLAVTTYQMKSTNVTTGQYRQAGLEQVGEVRGWKP